MSGSERGFGPVGHRMIRSRERVRDLAEVFTAEREVKAMLDLVGDATHRVETTFLEPACGDGNFLAEILGRKMTTIWARGGRRDVVERALLRAVMSVYAVDISPGNVSEARARLRALIDNQWSLRMNTRKMSRETSAALDAVLRRNVRVCDFLKGRHGLEMTEYVGLSGAWVLKDFMLGTPGTALRERGPFRLADLPHALGS